jgi:hypothetical protein
VYQSHTCCGDPDPRPLLINHGGFSYLEHSLMQPKDLIRPFKVVSEVSFDPSYREHFFQNMMDMKIIIM